MSLLSSTEVKKLKAADQRLLRELNRSAPWLKRRLLWRGAEVKRHAKLAIAGEAGLAKFKAMGAKRGLFDIRFEQRPWRDSDGEKRVFTLARAASTDMFPMGTHYWLRDNAIIGARFSKLEDRSYQRRGRELLLSCLTFISSVAQLKRFEGIVQSKSRAFVSSVTNWPRIFAAIDDNLTTQRHEGWAHKQDAWQMLAWYVLEALEEGRLAHGDLTDKHKRFLGMIVPFLAKVSFWRCENSGSWEEIEAVRTSVRAWEHRLIVRIAELARKPQYRFFVDGYTGARGYLGARYNKVDLFRAAEILDREASRVMLKDLPYESPMYSRSDPRFRRGDAALIYLLELDYVGFLGARAGKNKRWVQAMEERLLKGVLALQDDRSGGIARYHRDTYQRCGFFRSLTAAKLIKLYGAPSGDASGKFAERHLLVPRGRQAAWTHFVWQLAAWAGERFAVTGEKRFRVLHDRFFVQGLKLITGKEASLDLDEHSVSRIIRIPSWRMPECYIADITPDGSEMQFPSPHTPLNWAVCEMINAFRVRTAVLAQTAREK
jgi:hypothetical protein